MQSSFFVFLVGFLSSLHLAQAEVVLSEFLARNETSAQDESGDTADWLEIHNSGVEAVDLSEWSLTDNVDRPRKWQFPASAMLAPGERRLVFATGLDLREDVDGEWHTNFRLSAAGEDVALVKPDGELATLYPAQPQFDDVPYGTDASGRIGYLTTPTPGEANAELTYPGPEILETNHAPENPQPNEDITVTASVRAVGDALVGSVTLHHRVDYNGKTSVAMLDDGTEGDVEAGDGIYTAVISGRTLFGPRIKAGSVARWYVVAEDAEGQSSRFPPFLDVEGVDQSAEYLGVLVEAEIDTDLPVLHWYTDEEGDSRSRRGARAAAAYGGKYYDNIYVRQRGGATNGQSQKFVFNKAYPIEVNDDLPAVSELNLNAQGSDGSYLRQSLAFESFRWAGNASCHSFLTLMYLNGEEDRTGVLIEQVDDDFLDRNGFDPLGDLYKLVQRSNLMPVFADATTGVEKKTGDESDLSSFQGLVDGLDLEGDELKAYLMDALNLPQVMNYLAVRSITLDADDVRKNFYVYQDTLGTGEWSIFPWDKDWTFGVRGDGGPHLEHPFFGDQKHLKTNANQWNKLYDAIFGETVTRQMYLRRLRTLAEAMLQTEDTPPEDLRFENRIDEMFAQAEGDIPNGVNTLKRFFPERREHLFVDFSAGGKESLLPSPQEEAPPIEFGEIVFAPESGNQDHEYIQLINPNRVAIDISGWKLEGGVNFIFAQGTVIPSASLFNPGINQLYLSPDVTAFRSRPTSPTGGEGHFVQGDYGGHLSNLGETLILRNAEGQIIAETAYEGNPSDVERHLVISEIMYHPDDDRPDAEFLELANLSGEATLDLSGLTFSQGIDFIFPAGVELAPRSVLLLVQDEAAFKAVYGEDRPIAGVYGGASRLANGGETLKLEDAANNTILEFRYDDEDDWPLEADGQGASLELVDLSMRSDFDEPAAWLASTVAGGTPGQLGGDVPPVDNDLIDGDGDGVVALLEEAFGTSDSDPNQGANSVSVQRQTDGELVVETVLVTSEITLVLEISDDLQSWQVADDQVFTLSREASENGGERLRWALVGEAAEVGFRAIRLRASRQP